MKILLIDDDYNMVEVLRNLFDWDKLGFERVLTAYNIPGAKQLVEAENPGIIVCDIELPGESGLDFLEWLRGISFDGEFLFLTCHENFHFATRALELGASGYITKPVSRETLRVALEKAKGKLSAKQEARSGRSNDPFHKQLNVTENFWRNVIFYRITPKRDAIRNEILRCDLSVDAEMPVYMLLISVLKSHMEEGWQRDAFQCAIKNITEELIQPVGGVQSVVGYDSVSNYYVATILPANVPIQTLHAAGYRTCEEIKEHLHCLARCLLTPPTALENLAMARDDLEKLDRQTPVMQGGVLMPPAAAPKEAAQGAQVLDVAKIRSLLEEGNSYEIISCVQQAIQTAADDPRMADTVFSEVYNDYFQIVNYTLYQHRILAHTIFDTGTAHILEENAKRSAFNLIKWVSFITEQAICTLKELRHSETIVDKARRFIREHYSEDLSRDEVAASVYITPDYLSRLFKEETGLSINTYLMQVRMEKADELLREGNLTIAEVATQVGFNSLSYFSVVYKKITGHSPSKKKNSKR